MKAHYTLLILLLNLFALPATADNKTPTQSETITTGWLESILLQPSNVRMRAKLDTGAKTSSLHAIDIEHFKRDGQEWVRFLTGAYNKKAQLIPIEAPLIREVKIKDHERKSASRPVVELTFCLHKKLFTSEFSLTDRSQFNYPMLLGRRMLQQGVIVDPAMTFTMRSTQKECKQPLNENKTQRLAK